MSPTPSRVTVAVLTFRRLRELERVLPLVLAQAREVNSTGDRAHHVDVLVVDNDPAGPAVEVVRALADPLLRYVVEPRPGIAAARNRALDEAAHYDVLVFIDDDEIPQPCWLEQLLSTHRRTGAAAVAGAVVSVYEQGHDAWIDAGGFFARRHRASLETGAAIDTAATNNLLLDLRVVRRLGLRFDPSFGLSGGEDSMFTRQLSSRGGTMVWCGDAVVTDVLPASRMSRAWVMSRVLHHAAVGVRVDLACSSTASGRVRIRLQAASGGLLRAAAGVLGYTVGVATRSLRHRANGARIGARGVGMVLGSVGYVNEGVVRTERGAWRLRP